MSKHLVLVGSGHAHLAVLRKSGDYISRGHQVTLIAPSPYFYYSGMGPGLLSGIYRPREARFHARKMAEDRQAAFIEAQVIKIFPRRRSLLLASGRQIQYDVASFNVGSFVPLDLIPAKQEGVFAVKPIENLVKARRKILDHLRQGLTPALAVIGGGPAGVEIAGNLHRLVQESGSQPNITLFSGGRILAGLPDRARRLALQSLGDRGIRVLEEARVQAVHDGKVRLSGGRVSACDFAFIAVGIKPSPLFLDSGLPTGTDGGLLVNSALQCIAYPEIFGGGDCISFQKRPLDKVGVYAVRQGPVLYRNLLAALEGKKLTPFEPQKDYLLIFNLGNGRGIFRRRGWVWNGRAAFAFKNRLDRGFMRKYQVSGEMAEADDDLNG
jgi:NADH dehydrogenase FAD-containing subunit